MVDAAWDRRDHTCCCVNLKARWRANKGVAGNGAVDVSECLSGGDGHAGFTVYQGLVGQVGSRQHNSIINRCHVKSDGVGGGVAQLAIANEEIHRRIGEACAISGRLIGQSAVCDLR